MSRYAGKRFLILILALVMTLGLLPLHALAAEAQSVSVLAGQITVTSSGTNSAISSADDVVIASVYATEKTNSCTGAKTYDSNTNTVTITNSSEADSTLFFRYSLSLNSGSFSINGDVKTESSTFSAQVAAGENVTILLTSNSSDTTAASVTLSDFSLIGSSAYTVQFTKPVGGSATVNGTDLSTLTDGAALEVSATYADGVPVTATANAGYEFAGWLDENNTMFLATANGTIYPTRNCIVSPLFVPIGTALFGIGSKVYDNLSEAANIANSGNDKTIVLLNNGTLNEGDYTIPAGVILLIPFDAANTCYTSAPEVLYGSHTTPSAYRTLTLVSGASITVNGAISVSSKVSSTGTGSGSWNGTPTGPHGKIVMSEGSAITLNSGASLYAWGYVAGTGTVTALSGSNVYECFQIRNWRGGSATTSDTVKNYKIFPVSQYYVQNIEAKLVLNAGAKETVFTAPNMSSSAWPASATFIGAGGMFQITSGSITKQYLPDTDQLQVYVNGDISISSISLSISYVSLDSGSYVLPINSNIAIYLHSGVTTVKQDLALLPSAELHIDEGATLQIASGKNLYVYDKDEWGAYAYAGGQMNPVGYSTVNGTIAKRTAAGLTDAKVDVNGTVDVIGGFYTTESGAEIISTAGTGKIVFENGAGTESATYQATQSGTTMTKVDIPITSAKLHNGSQYTGTSDKYTLTQGAAEKATYYYDSTQGLWYDLIINDFDPEYRLNDYIWLNGTFTVEYSGDISDSGVISVLGDEEAQCVGVSDGQYYLVRKVLSNEFPDTMTFVLCYEYDEIKHYSNPITASFEDYATKQMQVPSITEERKNLLDAMITYGKWAKKYFNQEQLEELPDLNSPDLGDYNQVEKTQDAVSYNGVSISSEGVNFIFDERITLMYQFTLEIGDVAKTNITQIGLLTGDAESFKETALTAESGHYGTAYLLYYYDGGSGDNLNFPDLPDGVEFNKDSLEVSNQLPVSLMDMIVRFDLKSEEYVKQFAVRAYAVVDTDDDCVGDTVVYGRQFIYGLKNYIARKSNSESCGNDFKNFLYATWEYAEAAAKCFG